MATPDTLRYTRIPLNNGSGAFGFGTLIHDPLATKEATKTALEVGFRHLDCAERYRNEEAVGDAMRAAFSAGTIRREDVFVCTKLWNNNHRPERVKPAFDASRRRLQIDDVDCYLIHTPFAFRPGDDLDPRNEHGQVIYDSGVTMAETWQALERLAEEGQCKSIGVTDRHFGEAERDRGSGADQACSRAGRIASVFPSVGPTRLLPGAWDRSPSGRAVGT